MECSQRIFPGDHASTHQASPSIEQWQGAGPQQCLGEEAAQSQLRSSRRNYDTFGQISRDMLERGHDRDALQCRVKVKELRNAYRKAWEANSCSGGAPATCRFYKELDAILGGDPTSTLSTTLDTSEPSATRQEEEEEQSRSEGAEAEEDTPEFLDSCSPELFSSQEEGSQSWWKDKPPEEVPDSRLDPSQKLVGRWASINLVSSVPSQLPPQESMESSQEDIAEARPTAAKLEQILPPEVPSAETFSCNPAPCPHPSLEHQAGQLGMLSGEYLQMCLSSMGESPLHSNLASALLPAVPSSDVPLLPASAPPSPRASCMETNAAVDPETGEWALA
ncbi:Zinc finger and SCAN domain-containing protein 29 [Chelonia mydas]|uniref:Zinc finger and SCAN domain-containing protein 29 n=1 Tax=Chelonia mydas TaxID=8469 RepID=M7BT64_CHEMY|nr:Zinc finger and SCAN domain-containing protein 29 [Chelonia mydas]